MESGVKNMAFISNRPFIECVSQSELMDRLDIHFYKPELRKNSKKIQELPNLVPLDALVLEDFPIASGATPKGANYLDSGVPFLRVQNVRPMIVSFEDIVFIGSDTHKELSRSTILYKDILLTITGATFGYSAVFNSEEFTEANVNQHIVRIRIDTEKATPEYVALFLNSHLGYNQSLRYSTGGSRPALDFGAIKQFSIPCPQKSTQELILQRFETIGVNVRSIYKKSHSLLKKRENVSLDFDRILCGADYELFSKKSDCWNWTISRDSLSLSSTRNEQCAIIKPLPERLDPRFALPNRLRKLVDQKLNNWSILRNCAEIDRFTYRSDARLPHIAIDEMPNDPWNSFDINEGYSGSTILLEKGDIAISRLMPTIANGKCFIAWDQMTGSAEFIRVRAEEKHQRIILFWLKSALVREFLLANVRGSSASQKRFTEDDLKNCPIPKVIIENPEQYLPECEKALEDAMRYEQESFELQSKADDLLKKAKSNIFNLLDDDWFNKLVSEAKEALQ